MQLSASFFCVRICASYST